MKIKRANKIPEEEGFYLYEMLEGPVLFRVFNEKLENGTEVLMAKINYTQLTFFLVSDSTPNKWSDKIQFE